MNVNNYSLILFKMIKIAWFMIIKQMFQKWESDINNNNFNDWSNELNIDNKLKDQNKSNCLMLIWKYINEFMI